MKLIQVVLLVFLSPNFQTEGEDLHQRMSSISQRYQATDNFGVKSDPTPEVIAQVIRRLGGGEDGNCHVVLYFDDKTVSKEKLEKLQENLKIPLTLLDVTLLKFGLLTAKGQSKSLPIISLLQTESETDRCRIVLSWSASHFQRGLLILARFQENVLRKKDTIVLVTQDQKVESFIPELKNRVIIQRTLGRHSDSLLTSRSAEIRFVIKTPCKDCSSPNLVKLGEWEDFSGLRWNEKKPKNDFQGAKLTISYTTSLPNIFSIDNETFDGVEYRMLDYAARVLNFSYDLVKPTFGHWGRYINGSWTGKVGDIVYKKADLAIGGIIYHSERAKVATYSVMFHNELWSIVCPPPSLQPLWPNIVFPFRSESSKSVFMLLVVFHLVAYLVVTFVSINSKEECKENDHPLGKKIQIVFRTALYFYLRIIACLYFWNLFYCIIKPQYDNPIQSSSGLLESGKQFGLVKGTTVESVLSKSLDTSHRKVVANARGLSSISEGLYNLEENGMCIIGVPKRYAKAAITTRYTTRCGESALQVSEENLHTVMGGWLTAKKSPLKDKLDPIIMRLQGFGFVDKWEKDLFKTLSRKRKEKLPCIKQDLGPLNLLNLRLAFFLLVAGFGTSILIFIVEHLAMYLARHCQEEQLPTEASPYANYWLQDRRIVRAQRTWPEHVINRLNREDPSRHLLFREALYRYHLNLLLQNSSSQVPLQISKSMTNIPQNLPTNSSSLSQSRQSPVDDILPGKPLAEEKAQVTGYVPSCNQLTRPRSASLPSISSTIPEEANVKEVIVKPYETRLTRAMRLFPWGNSRPTTQSSQRDRGDNVRLPQTPDSPPPRLPPLKDPMNWIFGRNREKVNEATLKEITDSTISLSSSSDQEDKSDFMSTMRHIFSLKRNSLVRKESKLELPRDSETDPTVSSVSSTHPNRPITREENDESSNI